MAGSQAPMILPIDNRRVIFPSTPDIVNSAPPITFIPPPVKSGAIVPYIPGETPEPAVPATPTSYHLSTLLLIGGLCWLVYEIFRGKKR